MQNLFLVYFFNLYHRGADNSLARPTSRCIFFDGENISFDSSLVTYINSTNIPPIMIINRIYETQNLLSLQLVSFLVGLRTYQHPCNSSEIRTQHTSSGLLAYCPSISWINGVKPRGISRPILRAEYHVASHYTAHLVSKLRAQCSCS